MKSLKSQNKIRIIIKEPGKAPKTLIIKNDLTEFQELVGGYIEVFPFGKNVLCVVNEEGKLRGDCKFNFWYNDDCIMGTALFVGSDDKEGDFTDLRQKDVDKILLKFGGT